MLRDVQGNTSSTLMLSGFQEQVVIIDTEYLLRQVMIVPCLTDNANIYIVLYKNNLSLVKFIYKWLGISQ